MNKTHNVKGKLNIIKRLKGSYSGNPKYLVELIGKTACCGVLFQTETDAMLAYGITNYRDKFVNAEVRYTASKNFITNVEMDSGHYLDLLK